MAVLSITGEHDLSTAPDLRRHFSKLIGEGNPILLDLSPASFVDSSILGEILAAKRRAEETSVGFAVLHQDGDEAVGRVLEITGLRAELPVHRDRDDAAAAASSETGKAAAS